MPAVLQAHSSYSLLSLQGQSITACPCETALILVHDASTARVGEIARRTSAAVSVAFRSPTLDRFVVFLFLSYRNF